MSKSHMSRYIVRVRTPKGNDTVTREVEAIARCSIDAAHLALHALGVASQHFSLVVKHIGDGHA